VTAHKLFARVGRSGWAGLYRKTTGQGLVLRLIPQLSHSLGCGFAQEHGRRQEQRNSTPLHWNQPHPTLIPWRRRNKMGPLEVWLLASAVNGGSSFGFLKPPRLSVSRPSVPRRLLAQPIQNLPHIHRRRRGCPSITRLQRSLHAKVILHKRERNANHREPAGGLMAFGRHALLTPGSNRK
jgi:hypothetical protein